MQAQCSCFIILLPISLQKLELWISQTTEIGFLNFGQSAGWGLKNSHCWPLLSSIFDNPRKTMGQAPFVTFALRLYNCYNHAHSPGQHMWPSPGPRARLQSLQNSGSRMLMLRVKPLSERDRHWRNPRKKNYRKSSNIKARVSMHWRAQWHAILPRGCRHFQHAKPSLREYISCR